MASLGSRVVSTENMFWGLGDKQITAILMVFVTILLVYPILRRHFFA